MLNFWVCEPENQEEDADSCGDAFCSEQIDRCWEPLQTHETYNQPKASSQTDNLQTPQNDYSRHLHTSHASVGNSPSNATQVRVVSTGGSVADSKSKASASSGHKGLSSRNFYKRAQQQHQNLLHASKSQTVQNNCSEDLSNAMQNCGNIVANSTANSTTSTNYCSTQESNQHQGDFNPYDSLSQQYDNQSHYSNQYDSLSQKYDNQSRYSYDTFDRSHHNGHYGPVPNCDAEQSNNFRNPSLNDTYQEYDCRLRSMQTDPFAPVAPVNTFNNNNQSQGQYNVNEYAAAHPVQPQHPSNCNETPYEYRNFSQPHPQPNVEQPFRNNMMCNNFVGESHRTHAQFQNPQRLSVGPPAPAFQQHPFVSFNHIDLQSQRAPVAGMPSWDFQANSDFNINHVSTVEEIQDKEEGTNPSQGTEDGTAEDTCPTSFTEMYQFLCLFYKTYGHTNVPKTKDWYLLGSWVDSLRIRKKFQILKERGVNIVSQQESQLTHEEIRLLEDINFNWNTVTAKENDAIISVMKNKDKSKTPTPSSKASALVESDLISATTSEDSLSVPLTAGDLSPKDVKACKSGDRDKSNSQEKPLKPMPALPTCSESSSKSVENSRPKKTSAMKPMPALPTCSESSSKSVDKASRPKKTSAMKPMPALPTCSESSSKSVDKASRSKRTPMKNKRGISKATVSSTKSKRKRTKRLKKNYLPSSKRKKSDKASPGDDENNEDPKVLEQMWSLPFQRLVEFKKKHGNTAVPARNLTDPKLGHWVMTQRRQYHLLKKGKPSRMTKERVALLEGLGFQWSIRTNPTTMWKMRYEELIEYKKLQGDCLVPQRFHENPQLGTWVNTQRRHFKLLQEKKRSCMTEERLKKLNAIGFCWSTSVKTSSNSKLQL